MNKLCINVKDSFFFFPVKFLLAWSDCADRQQVFNTLSLIHIQWRKGKKVFIKEYKNRH